MNPFGKLDNRSVRYWKELVRHYKSGTSTLVPVTTYSRPLQETVQD
jgi:hypothetical protein